MLFWLELVLVVAVTFSKLWKDKKIEVALRIIAIVACAVIGLTNIGFTKENIANASIITSDNQIIIIDTYANIRAQADSASAKVGEVYKGMVFDVLDAEKLDKYTWYKICTASGKQGYVRGDLVGVPMKILITDDYINVREGASTSYNKIGEVYKGEQYIALTAKKQGSRTWYEIILSDGTIGYIGADGIKELK